MWHDRMLAVRMLAFAAFVPLLMRLPLGALARLLTRAVPSAVCTDGEIRRLHECYQTVIRRGSRFVRPGCLTRGVTLFYFLRKAGLEVDLVFGVGRVEGRFVGHCWLVREDGPFLEARDPRPLYTETYRISGRRSRAPGAEPKAAC